MPVIPFKSSSARFIDWNDPDLTFSLLLSSFIIQFFMLKFSIMEIVVCSYQKADIVLHFITMFSFGSGFEFENHWFEWSKKERQYLVLAVILERTFL